MTQPSQPSPSLSTTLQRPLLMLWQYFENSVWKKHSLFAGRQVPQCHLLDKSLWLHSSHITMQSQLKFSFKICIYKNRLRILLRWFGCLTFVFFVFFTKVKVSCDLNVYTVSIDLYAVLGTTCMLQNMDHCILIQRQYK